MSDIQWHKSSYSGGSSGNCVEVAETPQTVLVRDTSNRDASQLGFRPQDWAVFLAGLKAGRM